MSMDGQVLAPRPEADAPVRPSGRLSERIGGEDLRRSPSPIDRFSSYRLQKATFALFVLLPTLVAGLYYALVASDLYAVEFRAAVRALSGPAIEEDVLSALTKRTGADDASAGAYMVAGYVRSRNLPRDLEARDAGLLRRIFARRDADPLSRLPEDASHDELWRYLRGRIVVSVDRVSGLVMMRTLAFTPADSLRFAEAVRDAAAAMVDGVAERVRRDALRHAEEDLLRAAERFVAATLAMRDVRDQERSVDPEKSIEATANTLVGALREKLALERDQASMAALSPRSPQLQVNADRLRAMGEQVEALQRTLTDQRAGARTAAQTIASFEERELERRFSEKLLEMAQGSYEKARLEAERQHMVMTVFAPPALPEQADYPKALRTTALVGLCCFILWGVAMLVVAGVRDHRLTS